MRDVIKNNSKSGSNDDKYEILIHYVREKVNQLLNVMGTLPLREEELDDETLISIDPIGIISDSFKQILKNNENKNKELEVAYDEINTILNSVGIAIIVINNNYKIEISNQLSDKFFLNKDKNISGAELYASIKNSEVYIDRSCLADVISSKKQNIISDILIDDNSYDLVLTPVINKEESASGIVLAFIDTTERKRTEDNLRLAAAVFENSLEGVVVTDANNAIIMANKAFCKITGYQEEELIGNNPRILHSKKHAPTIYDEMWSSLLKYDSWKGEVWDRKKTGEIFPVLQTISVIRKDDGGISKFVSIISDISILKESQERLDYLAHHDPLTSLPNRALYNDRLNQAIERSKRQSSKFAVLFVDLDRFKTINDTLGHAVGDKLLIEVSKRLVSNIRKIDTVARLGGDEFIFLLDIIEHTNNISGFSEKLINAFKIPFIIDDHELHVNLSIGISVCPDDGTNVETLVKNADAAMYRVKDKGRNGYQFFTEEIASEYSEKLLLENNLRRALSLDEFELYYQPQYSLDTGELVSAEALLRWNHSELGSISPEKFIPIAEETGLIVQIGEWVLYEACWQLRKWRATGHKLQQIAINVSGIQFQRYDIVEGVLAATELYGLSPSDIEVEITESVIMENTEMAFSTLEKLQNLGVTIAVDDFGTGYSSLGYLKKLPVDKLKIDKDFVKDIDTNSEDKAIVKAIIALAKILQLEVVAEGVEKTQHAEILMEYQCEYVQGFLFARPVPANEFSEFIKIK